MHFLYAIPIILLPNAAYLPDKFAVAATLAVFFVGLLLGARDNAAFRQKGHLTAPLIGLLAAFVAGFVMSQWHDVSHAAQTLTRLQPVVLYLLLYLAYRHSGLDPRSNSLLIGVLLTVAVIAGFQAVLQGLRFDLTNFEHSQRASGPFVGSANRAGVFFAMFLPLLVAFAWQPGRSLPSRLLAAVGGMVLLAAIMLTFSRQSYVIAAVGIGLMLARRHMLLVLLAAVVVVLGADLLPESVIQRVTETRQVAATGAAEYDPSTVSRLELWRGAMEMLADHPWGVGLGRFTDYIGLYTNYPGMDPHNGFILVLAECGPFGLAMMLWLAWRLVTLALRLRGDDRKDRRTSALADGFAVCVLSMLAGNLYGSPFITTDVMANFWIACALIERHGIASSYTAAAPVPARAAPQRIGLRFPLAARAFPGRSMARTTRR